MGVSPLFRSLLLSSVSFLCVDVSYAADIVVGQDNADKTLNSEINGGNSVIKRGKGTVTLAGSNTYSGNTTVEEGILKINVGQNYIDTNSVNVSSLGNTLPSLEVENSLFSSYGNVAVGIADRSAGSLTITGPQTRFLTGNPQASIIAGNGDPSWGSGSNNAMSVVTVSGGASASVGGVIVANYQNAVGEFNVVGQGSRLEVNSGNLYVNGDGRGTVNIRDGGSVVVNNQVLFGSGAGTGFSSLNIGPNGTLTVGDLSQSQPGIQANLPSSQYMVRIDDGTIRNYTGSSLNTSVNMALDGPAHFDTLDQSTGLTGVLSGVGGVDKEGSGTLVLGADNTFTGGVTVKDGTLVLQGNNDYSGDSVVQHGTLQVGTGADKGSIGSSANVKLQETDASLNINRSNDVALSAAISGKGNVVQSGAGATRLTGNNSYQGNTTVNAGSLIVDGNQSGATGVTTVNNGGKLEGNGTIGGDVSLKSGSSFSPGESGFVGTLNVNGSVQSEAGASQTWKIGKNSAGTAGVNDLINVKKDLTLAGAVNISVNPQGSNLKQDNSLQDGIYRIYNYGGSLTKDSSFHVAGSEGTNTSSFAVQTAVDKQVNLVTNAQHLSFWDPIHGGTNGSDGVAGKIHGGDGAWSAPNSGQYITVPGGSADSPHNNWTDVNAEKHGPWTSGNFAVFQGNAGTISVQSKSDVNGPVYFDGMQFSNSDGKRYIIGNDQGYGDLYATSGTTNIRVGDGGEGVVSALVNSVINDSEVNGGTSINKLDTGTLVLGGNNNYRGTTTITEGTLQLGDGGSDGTAGSGDIINNSDLAVNHNNKVTLNQNISGIGDLRQIGTGVTELTGNNTYSGVTHVDSGELALANSGTISNSSGLRLKDDAKFNISSTSGDNSSITSLDGRGSVELGGKSLNITNGNRTVRVAYNDQGEQVYIKDNVYSLSNESNVVYINKDGKTISSSDYNPKNGDRAVDLNKDGFVVVDNRYDGVISGNGGVNITGGLETFGGKNTYTGTTSVSPNAKFILPGSLQGGIHNEGTVDVDGGTVVGQTVNDNGALLTAENNATLGDVVNNSGKAYLHQTQANSVTSNDYVMLDGTTVARDFSANGGIFQVSGNNATVGSLSGAASGQLDGRLTINNANGTYAGVMSGVGGVTVTRGFQTMTGNSVYDGQTIIGKDATLQFGDGVTTGRITSENIGTDPKIVNDGSLIINNSELVESSLGITGAGTLTQAGSGTTILSGSNSYTGGTTVSRGTLRIDGDQSGATGDTVVQSGGNLAGKGTIGGNLEIQDGGGLSPGPNPTEIGTLNINGNLVEQAGSRQHWDIGQASTEGGAFNDFVNVRGDLTLNGTLIVNANSDGPSVHDNVLDSGVYRFYSYDGKLTNNGLRVDQGNLSIPSGYTGDYLSLQTSIPKQVNLVADAKNLNFWDGGDQAHHGADPAVGNGQVDGGNGEWTASGGNNWTNSTGLGNVSWNNEGRAIFGAEPGVVTVKNQDSSGNSAPVLTSGMQFISGNAENHYKITGDELYAANGGTVIRVGDGSSEGKNIVADLNTTINDSAVNGGSQLIKLDLGTLILSKDNDYRGVTMVAQGTLQLGDGGEAGSVGPANIANYGRIIVNRSNDLALGQVISGTGSFTQQGSGTTTLANQNTYTGETVVKNGSLVLSGEGSIKNSSGLLTNDSTVFDMSGISSSGTSVKTLGGQGQVHLGDKDLALDNANRTVRVTIADKSVDITSNQYTGPDGNHLIYVDKEGKIISSSQYDKKNGDLIIDLSKDGTVITDNQYSGVISGQGGVSIKQGIETLSAQNTYTGTTSVSAGAGLNLPGSVQGGLHNEGRVDINGGGVAGQTVNDNADATITAENNARLGDIVNKNGRVALANSTADNITNASNGVFSAAAGQITSLDNSGTASLAAQNIVTGNVINNGELTMDGNIVRGTLSSNGGTFTVTQNNAVAGSLAGEADGKLDGNLILANAHDTYAGKLSGAAGLRVANGREVLSGDSTYTGETSIDEGAILQLGSGGATGSVASTRIRDDGTLEINRNNDVTLSQAVFGSGNVVQSGTGRTVIKSPNAYTGATTILHGTLALEENGGVLRSSGVHVYNDGVFDISAIEKMAPSGGSAGVPIPSNPSETQSGNDGKTVRVQSLDGNGNVVLGSKNLQIVNGNTDFGNLYSGMISGDGNVTISGGQEIFAGNNTYRGKTDITKDSQLILGNNSTAGSIQSDVINVDGNLTIRRSNLEAMGQNITGAGTLTQDGEGTTELTGNSTYTGKTTVNRGNLAVEGSLANSDVQVNAGTLSGSGMVKSAALEQGATLAPAGDGRIGSISVGVGQDNALVTKKDSSLSVDAQAVVPTAPPILTGLPTLTSKGKTYQVLDSDQIHVTGSAQIDGNTKISIPQGDMIKPGLAYKLVTTTNGVAGSLGSLSGLPDGLSVFATPRLQVSDDNKDMNLLLERNNVTFEDVGETRNQREAGAGLAHVSEDDAAVQAMLYLNRDDARKAENTLSGEVHASARTVLIQDSYYVRQAALDRLDSASCDGSDSHGISTADMRTGQKSKNCLSNQPVLWGEAYGSLGGNSGDGNASSLHHSSTGFVMGADAPILAQWRVGGLVGYGHSMFNEKSGSSASGHSDNITLGAYAGREFGNVSLKMGASYTWNILSTRRTASIGRNYSNRLTSGYLGGTAQAFGEVGYKFHAKRTIIEPFANVAYVNQHTDSYREHGGGAALNGRSMNTGVTFSTFGVRASSTFMVGKMKIVPHAMAAYRHAFGLTTPTVHQQFASANNGNMDVAGVPLSRDSAVIDTGISAQLTDRVNLDVSYIGQYGNHSMDSGARANVKFQF